MCKKNILHPECPNGKKAPLLSKVKKIHRYIAHFFSKNKYQRSVYQTIFFAQFRVIKRIQWLASTLSARSTGAAQSQQSRICKGFLFSPRNGCCCCTKPSGINSDDFTASSAHQEDSVQAFCQNFQELHVWIPYC